MDLNIIWFFLIAILYIGFFVLEGFDFGVGILLPFLGKNDTERRVIINTIGPHWDGNEVWLITAGGATFAAFPHWYATLFSGFYLAFFLLLIALIVRGVAFEFRSKNKAPQWRTFWDWAIFAGSLLSSLLLGVAFANLAKGIPVDGKMIYTGSLWTLLNPYGLLGGLAIIASFALIGANFLSIKTTEQLAERSSVMARKLWLPATILNVILVIASFFYTDVNAHSGISVGIIIFILMASLLLVGYFLRRHRSGWAFGMMGLYIALLLVSCFLVMYPRVVISSLDPAFSLTIYSASSSPYTLRVMTIIALIFVPIVLLYQGWSYWVFRKRIGVTQKELTY
jgi:cytochrome d ubiquinol oxidase subunit II